MVIKQFQNGKYTYNYKRFVADTEEDVKKIVVDVNGSMIGNEVYVVTTGKTYVLGSGKIWYAATGEKIDCGCKDVVPESTIWSDLDASKDSSSTEGNS